MRNLVIIGAAAALATPAVAQPAPDEAPYISDRDIAAADYAGEVAYGAEQDAAFVPPMLDQREVADMAQRMDRLVGAVMDLPIGGIVAAIDPEGGGEHRRDDTVRDFATRDDPHAEARIRGGIHASTAGVGALSAALAQMMPVFQRSMEEMERSVAAAMRPFRRD